jgi:hypothetical protein
LFSDILSSGIVSRSGIVLQAVKQKRIKKSEIESTGIEEPEIGLFLIRILNLLF